MILLYITMEYTHDHTGIQNDSYPKSIGILKNQQWILGCFVGRHTLQTSETFSKTLRCDRWKSAGLILRGKNTWMVVTGWVQFHPEMEWNGYITIEVTGLISQLQPPCAWWTSSWPISSLWAWPRVSNAGHPIDLTFGVGFQHPYLSLWLGWPHYPLVNYGSMANYNWFTYQ